MFGRLRSKRWVRGEPASAGAAPAHAPSKCIWTRTESAQQPASSSLSQQSAAQPPQRPHDSVGVRPRALPLQAQLPLLGTGSSARANGQLCSSGQSGATGATVAPATAATPARRPVGAARPQPKQYVHTKPNQLRLSAAARQPHAAAAAGPGAATARPAAPQPAARPAFGGASASPAAKPAAAGGGKPHPRDALQRQMAERAAAIEARPHPGSTLAPWPAAPTPVAVVPVHRQGRGLAALHARKAGSKCWVRPGATDSSPVRSSSAAVPAAAAPAATAAAPAIQAAQTPHPSSESSALKGGATGKPPCSTYRPRLPAWAWNKQRLLLRSGYGTPSNAQRQRGSSVSSRVRRAARSWQRPSPTSPSPARAATAAHAVASARKAAKTWQREEANGSAAPAVAPAPQPATASSSQPPSAADAAAPTTAAGRSASMPAAAAAMRTATSPAQMQRRGGKRAGQAAAAAAKPRASKLQRIGDHMYRVGGGKGGRTLQRQPHTPAPAAASTPAQVAQQVSAKKALRYSVRGRHRRVLIRRLSGAGAGDSPPRSPVAAGSAARKVRRGLRLSLGCVFASSGAKKRASRSRLGSKARARSTKPPPQVYCTEFCRTGRCSQRSRCKYVHDSDKVAICSKWLQGRCDDAACLLQHARRPELMPVCTFFLQGACGKADCPYLHVNLDPDARVCEAFLRGWCPGGTACRQKHLTPDMVRRLKRERQLRAGDGAEAALRARKRVRRRYFEADNAAISGAETATGAQAAAAAAEVARGAAADASSTEPCFDSSSGAEEEEEEAEWAGSTLALGEFVEL